MNINKKIVGQGPRVVILHGWSCNMRHMQPLVEMLSDRFCLTLFDLPGMGRSDWSDDIDSVDAMADCLLEHLPEKAIYIGWSFGGLVSMSIAARFPHKVERFLGLCATPRFVAVDHWVGVPQPGFKAAFPQIRKVGLNEFFGQVYAAEFENQLNSVNHQALLDILQKSEVNLDIMFKGVHICDQADFRDRFAKLTCPIDLIMGSADASLPAEQWPQIQALNDNVNIHVIKGAQHLPHWTHPNEFAEKIRKIF